MCVKVEGGGGGEYTPMVYCSIQQWRKGGHQPLEPPWFLRNCSNLEIHVWRAVCVKRHAIREFLDLNSCVGTRHLYETT